MSTVLFSPVLETKHLKPTGFSVADLKKKYSVGDRFWLYSEVGNYSKEPPFTMEKSRTPIGFHCKKFNNKATKHIQKVPVRFSVLADPTCTLLG